MLKSVAHMEIQGSNIAIDSLIYAMLAPYEVASLTFESGFFSLSISSHFCGVFHFFLLLCYFVGCELFLK
jgi:hypothetical protein